MVKTTVNVDGMMCGMCESHVNEAVRRAFEGSIKKVTSSHSKKKTEIISENALDEEKLKAAIKQPDILPYRLRRSLMKRRASLSLERESNLVLI